jgi:hypothetical protein
MVRGRRFQVARERGQALRGFRGGAGGVEGVADPFAALVFGRAQRGTERQVDDHTREVVVHLVARAPRQRAQRGQHATHVLLLGDVALDDQDGGREPTRVAYGQQLAVRPHIEAIGARERQIHHEMLAPVQRAPDAIDQRRVHTAAAQCEPTLLDQIRRRARGESTEGLVHRHHARVLTRHSRDVREHHRIGGVRNHREQTSRRRIDERARSRHGRGGTRTRLLAVTRKWMHADLPHASRHV